MTESNPFAEDLKQQGDDLLKQGRFEEAVAAYTGALALDPAMTRAMNNCAAAYGYMQREAEAESWFRRALEIRPADEGVLTNFRRLLVRLQRYEDMLPVADGALAADPACMEAHYIKAIACNALRHFEEAHAWAEAALRLKADDPLALFNKGVALAGLGRADEGLTLVRMATEIALQKIEDFNGLKGDFFIAVANFYVHVRDLEAARLVYERALEALPQPVRVQASSVIVPNAYGYFLLSIGDQDGWAHLEWRHITSDRKGIALQDRKRFTQPLWTGEDAHAGNKTILVLSEQGFGDDIHFSRYVIKLVEKGYKIILEAQDNLFVLFQNSFESNYIKVVRKIPYQDEPYREIDFDCYIYNLSLPYRVGTRTIDDIPSYPAYLKTPPQRTEFWAKRLENSTGNLKVGLVWAGNPMQSDDRNRSMPAAMMTPLLERDGVDFYSIRKGKWDLSVFPPGRIVDLGEEIGDFADTAAIIDTLDLTITVCTSVAHLAGALGRPVWTMLSYVPSWRWMLEGDTTPWYPSMRLFRQQRRGDWPGVIETVGKALDEVIAAR